MEASRLIDRRLLKRRLIFWRVVAVAGLLALVGLAVYKADFRQNQQIARIAISGIIVEDNERDKALARIAKDDNIKALIVRINTPGGSTTGSEELYLGLRRIAEKKPVVSVIGTVGASGGYIAAIASDRIYVRETSITGSIGVLMEMAEFSGLLEKLGVRSEQITSGAYKGKPSAARPMNEKVRKAIQSLIDDAHAWFVGLVRERRKMDAARLDRVTNGRVFTGRQAVKETLVDAIGGEREARKWLEKERKIKSSLPVVDIRWGDDEGLVSRLFSRVLGNWLPPQSLGLDGLVAVWHPSLASAERGAAAAAGRD